MNEFELKPSRSEGQTGSIPATHKTEGIMSLANIPTQDIPIVMYTLKKDRNIYRSALRDVLVPREEIDSRIVSMEYKLNYLNEQRSRHYGFIYEPPEVFYIDREQSLQHAIGINNHIRASGKNILFDENAAAHFPGGNFILVFTDNFDDPDVSAYDTVRRLRHEMSHAGSRRVIEAYPRGAGSKQLNASRYGGYIHTERYLNKNDGNLGLVFDEGHRAIEDEAFGGRADWFKSHDPWVSQLPALDELFPDAKNKYESLRESLVKNGEIPKGKMLMCYKKDRICGDAEEYTEYRQLMERIYRGDPDLYGLALDMIYGGSLSPFALRVNQVHGVGAFRSLISATDQQDTQELLQNRFKSH